MKIKVAVLTMGVLFSAVTLPAAEARVFEGVNMEELGQTQRLRDMPEIYERDPANAPRFRLRKAVVQIPLGAAWLSFNSESNVYYLNKVPGENAAVYFGPVAGDAFEKFKLEERFLATLCKDGAPEMDVEYRLALMVRTGDAKLRARALRVMTAALAPDISTRTRIYHVAKFSELAAGLEGDDAAPLRAAIAQTERQIEESKVTLPDSAYAPGNDELARQGKLKDWMKPGVAVPDAAWGEAVDGLRAAAVFSTTEPKLGQEVGVWLLVENTSDRVIRFGCSDVVQGAEARITGADGKEVPVRRSWYTGLSPIVRHKLKPGERVTLAKKQLVFDAKNAGGQAGFGAGRVEDGPGEFRVRYEFSLSGGLVKGEWGGRLTTGETKMVVSAQPDAAPAPPKAPR